MATGISLHLGLNSVDPQHYAGWSGELTACEADAQDLEAIARSKGFKTTLLLTNKATRKAMITAIRAAAKSLNADDIFMLSYSGHGGQLPDKNGDEDDGQDETWCLYDGELVDDEIYSLYGEFAAGVRVLVFSDSCHSGTVTKVAYYSGSISVLESPYEPSRPRFRFMPPAVANRTYRHNQAFYDKILSAKKEASVKATVLLISGCQDNQLSADGTFNGRFTQELLTVWNNGSFEGNYPTFCSRVVKRMPPDQTPNYYMVGAPNAAFESQDPFTI